ncbi:hypothetical protein GCM10027280_36900 [Micromonospora polyrhachis]|uniref:BNR repeat-like domain-containing protein n=1 Tax=Micromonospora polyrhachis TaxID=1282883 RepID=A0A7W7WSH8_9ACTN|nr:hypothetical protein [Micromonospora polyrhachis]MBB4962281.1 hypothetical protein [Micromonospora polyrhachis]
MPEPDYHGLRDQAARSAHQPAFETVRKRAGRLRARRRMKAATVGVAVAALLGIGGFAVLPPATTDPDRVAALPSSSTPGDDSRPRLLWLAVGGDASHLYTVASDCMECPFTLKSSSDGGRSWRERPGYREFQNMAPQNLKVLGPEILFTSDAVKQPGGSSSPLSLQDRLMKGPFKQRYWISVDDGVSWSEMTTTTTTVGAAPVNGGFDMQRLGEKLLLCVVDPANRQIAPLATQPPLVEFELVGTPAKAGVWVQGYDPATRRPAVAVSRDRGVTWEVSVFEAEAPARAVGGLTPAMYLPNVATTDGRTAYAVFIDDSRTQRVYRSTDAGRTWARTNPDGRITQLSLAGPESYVTPDGSHVLTAQHPSAGYVLLASRDGRTYAPLADTGLPPAITGSPGVGEIAEGRYFYLTREQLYLSDDGMRWWPVAGL